MKTQVKNALKAWASALFDPRKALALFRLPSFFLQLRRYRRLSSETVRNADLYPCLTDAVTNTPFDPHYFYQAAWLARRLAALHPESHLDIGSSVAMHAVLSGFVPTKFLDYRPLNVRLSGLTPIGGSVTALPFADRSVVSLSSLHVVEHVGLGRYGDPLDAQGSKRALRELARVLAPGGRLFLSLPVGRERVCFNAHRVHSTETVLSILSDLSLAGFSFVDDAGKFHEDVAPESSRAFEYACGMFEFVRLARDA